MASQENPYGVALLSSCFWPYTFKHNGFKYFVKFCEKYGIPWAIGRYPKGTAEPEQKELLNGLTQMVEDAVAAIPDDGSVELLEHKHKGEIAQERLINLCNREMSKALTSQTLATEIQGNGSRAAAETHRGREESVNESDRYIIVAAMNELFSWITEINIAGARPPTFQFYEEIEARMQWVKKLNKAREFMDIPAQFAHERLQIPRAKNGEAVLPRNPVQQSMVQFVRAYKGSTSHDFNGLCKWFSIFMGGEQVDSKGTKRVWSETELDEIVNNTQKRINRDLFSGAPLVVGHPKTDSPAYGWTSEIKRVRNTILIKGSKLHAAFAKGFKKGQWPNRSIRIAKGKDGLYLRHIGFLGAVPPAIEGMNSVYNKTRNKTCLNNDECFDYSIGRGGFNV